MSQTNPERPAEQQQIELTESGRADAVLSRALGVSRSQAADWISRGLVTEADSGDQVLKSTKVTPGTRVVVTDAQDPDPLEVKVEVVQDLTIIAEDPDYLVVDKPVGVAAHPSPGWVGPTVVGGLAGLGYRISTSGAAERQGIVQRLDVGTSGLMVVATSETAYTHLKDQFRDRVPAKMYHALVQGLPDPVDGTIDAPIGRDPGHDWKFAVLDGGRHAVTHYETLESFGTATLIRVGLETGRTHQIRVHFSAMRHPLAGDLTYGADPKLAANLGLTRQWLHAHQLGFQHPTTGEWVTYTSPYPNDLQYALSVLRNR
ncbi:RluA family pseudouridine synthase [Auritidibacter ignavus]|uniref:RluA family pseudouridine synthase n=1 Tax=Auritidibacter ignavus TaxID=678932 RepID=UPI00244D0316|nr:RluA family pseudouridine synthase [Auritidibacter ignavus]WGH86908.1 RluA family pseudouridine synthase [Auritidibacter ignavus]WGH89192.1 RluA family pseudouridine synthase [Auritidibacter ignavus]WHS34662.1 RluA family pseudouridine synthase [Auritidibacter ignavus]